MGVKVQQQQQSIVAYLSGELDHHVAKGIREEIDRACEESAARLLILDFQDVTFMDSSGIGLVMGRYQLMQTLGGELALSNLPAPIKRVMRLAGLDRLAVLDKRVQSREKENGEEQKPGQEKPLTPEKSKTVGGQQDESDQ